MTYTIGTSGVSTVRNVHEIADQISNGTRCVYVDFAPVAAEHCRLLLERRGDPQRECGGKEDVINIDEVWDKTPATGILDLHQPIALIMVWMLHFVLPDRGVHAAVQRYRGPLPPGSHLVSATPHRPMYARICFPALTG